MKERLTTYERREEIRLLLIKERSTTTTFLMNYFGVSRKTIYNDIVFLNSVLPLETYCGNGGGVFLKMYYFAPLSSFKEKHLNMKGSVDFLKIKT